MSIVATVSAVLSERTWTVVLVALSGGADSTALLHAMCENASADRPEIVACHFDHGLRPHEEHGNELAAVRDLCARLGVPLVVGHARQGEIRQLASHQRSGIEAAARSLRYRFFEEAASAVGAQVVCTGHTEDDQVETVMMALGRGVDPIALAGIPSERPLNATVTLMRPLLTVRREAIEVYLTERRVSWITDPSNREMRYTRNRVRHELLPEIERDAPDYRDTLLAISRNASAKRAAASASARSLQWVAHGEETRVDAEGFFAATRESRIISLYEEAHRRGMIKPSSRIGVAFFAPLLGADCPVGTVIEGRGCRISRVRGDLRWTCIIVHPTDFGYLRSVTFGVPVEVPTNLAITVFAGEKEITDDQPIVIELKEVREPLFVRSHRSGDVIRTAGGHKAVGDLLVELSIPREDRQLVPVICDRAGVAAVIGTGHGSGRNVVASRQPSVGTTCTVVVREDKRDV